MIPGVLLSLAALCLLATLLTARWLIREAWLSLILGACAAGLGAALCILADGGGNGIFPPTGPDGWTWRGTLPIAGEIPLLRLDGISALFLALLCTVGGAGAVYGREYWSDEHHPASARRGRGWWSMMILCMGIVLLSGNSLHFLIGWELFAVSSYFLITLDNRHADTRAAGWLYLAASHAGTLCLFAFFSTLAARTGSWELGPALREQLAAHAGATNALFWLMLLAFGIKAGLFPMHIWLPSAHAGAPSHVSALMSGVAIKMGIYGLVRFTGWLPVPPMAGWVILGIGATSALLGIAFAFAQTDFKRLLAYCSVENVGIIAIGIGGALITTTNGGTNAAWGRLLLAGALLHVWNHGLFKALLFFGAGSVLHATGTREMSRLGGLWQRMPWTAATFALGAAAVSALPPLNGFVSEWLIYLGLFDAATSQGPAMWAAMPAIVMLAMSGALALASFVKASAMIFLGAPRTETAAHAHECGPLMRGAMLTLASLCVLLGLAPALLWPAISRVAGAWNPAWTTNPIANYANINVPPPPLPPPPIGTLTLTHLLLATLFATAAVWLWRRAKAGRGAANETDAATLQRSLTWDCGYARPTARMQYTGGSFAGIVAEWFGWIFRPEKKLRRPHGVFPPEAHHMERVPETVLERVLGPLARGVMRVNAAVRRLQHGRLQFYIAYLACGLAVLGIIVWWSTQGGTP